MQTTELNTLDDRIRRLSYLDESMDILKAEYEKLRTEILEEIYTSGVKSLDTQYGKVGYSDRKSYDLSGFAEVTAAKAAFDAAKKEAEKTAPVTTKPYLTFSRNKAVVPQADPMKKQAVYVASIITKVAAK